MKPREIIAKYQGCGMIHDTLLDLRKFVEGKKKPPKMCGDFERVPDAFTGGYNCALDDIIKELK